MTDKQHEYSTIQGSWEAFKETVCPDITDADTLESIKRTFMAGAYSAVAIATQDTGVVNNAAVTCLAVNQLGIELDKHIAEIEAEEAAESNGD